jgi:hypothetical protein
LEGSDGFLIPVNIFRYGEWDVWVNHERFVIGVVRSDSDCWGYPSFNSRVIDEMVKRLPEVSEPGVK